LGNCLCHALRLGGQRRLLCGGCACGGESGRYLLDDQVPVGCGHLELYVERELLVGREQRPGLRG